LAPTEWGRFTIFPPSDETVKQIARPVARALIQTDCAIVEPEMQEEEKWPRKAKVEYHQSRTGWRWRVLSAGNRKMLAVSSEAYARFEDCETALELTKNALLYVVPRWADQELRVRGPSRQCCWGAGCLGLRCAGRLAL